MTSDHADAARYAYGGPLRSPAADPTPPLGPFTDDPTLRMRARTASGLERRTVTVTATGPRPDVEALRRAVLAASPRQRRLADEVDQHLAEVAAEWRRALPAVDHELARGIGTACLVIGAALILVALLAIGTW